jgi:hypothetical protein
VRFLRGADEGLGLVYALPKAEYVICTINYSKIKIILANLGE